jgi:hypothetical protein
VASHAQETGESDVAANFQQYLDDEDIEPTTPPEWFAAWNEYVQQYNDTEHEDGEPYDIDSDAGYDPYSGGPEMDDPIDPFDCGYDDGY